MKDNRKIVGKKIYLRPITELDTDEIVYGILNKRRRR